VRNAWSCAAIIALPVSVSDLPSTATERAFVTNKLSICTSNILARHYFAVSFFSLRTLLTLRVFMYFIPSFFLSLFSFYWLSSFRTFAAVLTVDSYSVDCFRGF
jgi:hypothetical protein